MKKSDVSQRLIKAFFHSLENKHYSKISVTDLITEAGCSRTTFYRHYTDVLDMYGKICEEMVDAFLTELADCLAKEKGSLSSLLDEFCSKLEAQKYYIGLLCGENGGKGIDASGAKDLLEFLDTDFVIDQDFLAFTANYDEYNGVVGQANRVLYDLVDMLVSDAGMQKLALTEGNNDNFTANLEKICATANDMMASAEAIMTDPEVEALLGQAGIDMSALLGSFDLDGFLRLFETKEKTEDVAADVSVTEALIMASEHIVDAFFPDTVKSELYVDNYATGKFTEKTVQEYFTGAENDAVIASNNMDSLNARKAALVPAALNLVRDAGVLPFFAKCDKDHSVENLVLKSDRVDSTCSAVGHEAIYVCEDCGYTVGGEEIALKSHKMSDWKQTKAPSCEAKGEESRNCVVCGQNPETRAVAATGHVTWSAWTQAIAPSCEAKGLETRTCSCGKNETRDIPATGHADADANNICDTCGHDWNEKEDTSFFGKIKAFFQKIIDWFRNLFK